MSTKVTPEVPVETPRYTIKICSIMETGGWWVIDNSKSPTVTDRFNEWFHTQEEADRDAKAKNEGKTRTCQPRSEETKAKMREARERKKEKAGTDGAKHPAPASAAGTKRRSKRATK